MGIVQRIKDKNNDVGVQRVSLRNNIKVVRNDIKVVLHTGSMCNFAVV